MNEFDGLNVYVFLLLGCLTRRICGTDTFPNQLSFRYKSSKKTFSFFGKSKSSKSSIRFNIFTYVSIDSYVLNVYITYKHIRKFPFCKGEFPLRANTMQSNFVVVVVWLKYKHTHGEKSTHTHAFGLRSKKKTDPVCKSICLQYTSSCVLIFFKDEIVLSRIKIQKIHLNCR